MTKDEVVSIKKETTKQATCNKWKFLRENRITSSNAHKIFIRKIFLNHCLITNSAKKKKKKSKVCPRCLKTWPQNEPGARHKCEIINTKRKEIFFLEKLDLLYNAYCSS